MLKKFFCLFLVSVFVFILSGAGFVNTPNGMMSDPDLSTLAEESIVNVQKNDDYADDHVIVTLTQEASMMLKEYSEADFSEIQCTKVTDLSKDVQPIVAAKVGNTNAALRSGETVEIAKDVIDSFDVSAYYQTVCLELAAPGKENVLQAIKALQSRNDVLYAEPDYAIYPCAYYPNDPYVNLQWGIGDTNLNEAWSISRGITTVEVGVLDSGIDGTHPELSSRIDVARSRDFTSSGSNQSNYLVDEVTDERGHGTHVAGIIAAKGNNSIGISGVAPNITLVSLKVFENDPTITQDRMSSLIEAIYYANSAGIPILNFSGIVNSGSEEGLVSLKNAIQSYTGLLVCAAGNKTENTDVVSRYPSKWDLSNVLVIGALSNATTIADFSNYGQTTVDIFAPGSNILSSYVQSKCTNNSCIPFLGDPEQHYSNGYHYMSGTSMAAPYATGVAALIKSAYYSLTAAQIKARILDGAQPVSVLSGLCVTGGKLHAYRALHNHPYTDAYQQYNSSVHIAVCSCGVSKQEAHTYRQLGSISVCTKCSYSPNYAK